MDSIRRASLLPIPGSPSIGIRRGSRMTGAGTQATGPVAVTKMMTAVENVATDSLPSAPTQSR